MHKTMSFNDLTLDYRGQVSLCSSLATSGSLSAARLACRGLRELVDGGTTELKFWMYRSVFEELKQWYRARGRPFRSPLLRWQMVQRLNVKMPSTGDPTWLVETLRLLFTGIPADALARITVLRIIDPSLDSRHRPAVSSLLAALPPQLPGLTTLDISGCSGPVQPSTDPPDVFRALGDRFPALEDLVLPENSCLDGVEALAGLRRLRIRPAMAFDQWSPSPSFVEAMSSLRQLTQLRELCLIDCFFPDGDKLGRFLGAVPLGVEALELKGLRLLDHEGYRSYLGTVRMQFEGGRLMLVEVASAKWEGLELDILAEGLLGWAALGPQLPRLRFNTLNNETMALPENPDSPMMQELLPRCVHTEVVHLRIDVSPPSALSASRAVLALGTPRQLSLRFDCTWDYIPLDLQQATAAVATPGLALESADPEQVWQEAVRRVQVKVARDQQAGPAAGGSSSAGPATDRPSMAAAGGSRALSSCGGSDSDGEVVLLCGNPSQNWRAWLLRLPAESSVLLQRPEPTAVGGSPEGARLYRSTMLVGCSSKDAAALVATAAAVRKYEGVEAFQLPYNTVREAALCLVQPVLQDLWASSAGGGGASVEDRVERLMGLMRGIGGQLRDMDPEDGA